MQVTCKCMTDVCWCLLLEGHMRGLTRCRGRRRNSRQRAAVLAGALVVRWQGEVGQLRVVVLRVLLHRAQRGVVAQQPAGGSRRVSHIEDQAICL